MSVRLRNAEPTDAAVLGDICYRAFKAIAEAHGFPPDLPSVQAATGVINSLTAHPRVFGVVAQIDGRIVGSNFLDERNAIAGVGPITVDPEVQDGGVGRALMGAVLARSKAQGFAGVRLVQAGYHSRSLALYLRLGFEAREQLACLQGPPIGGTIIGAAVRAARPEDLAACNGICFQVHGHDRGGDLADAIASGSARVVERARRITGYATATAFFGHAVGEANDDLMALIGAAEAFGGAGLLLPTRNGELIRWCLGRGLRITQTMTLMSNGLYNQPMGAWAPSIVY
jgi:predicted N-acetyltransferase YhbS